MMDNESRDFDWLNDAGDVIVRAQSAIAIYPGPSGVVIRRQGDLWSGDGDDVIWFRPEDAPAIAAAILTAVGLDPTVLASGTTRVDSKPKGKDPTAAERQRRRRKRQREEPTADIFDSADRDSTAANPVTP